MFFVAGPHNGYWQYVFWQDAAHLVAWYNGVVGKTSNTVGLYRYNVAAAALSQVVSLRQLGLSTLFNAVQNAPLLLAMRYSNGQGRLILTNSRDFVRG